MEGQFGGKPKPPSWLWQMIKICFVLLTRYPQITTRLLALQTQAPRPPLDRCATSLLLFLLISTKPRRCHWHLVEMQWQRVSFKVPFGSRMPPSAEMHPPGGWGTQERHCPWWLQVLGKNWECASRIWPQGLHYSPAHAFKTKKGWQGCS